MHSLSDLASLLSSPQELLGCGVQQLSERLARSGAIMRFVCRQRSQTAAPVTTPVDSCVAAGMRNHSTGCARPTRSVCVCVCVCVCVVFHRLDAAGMRSHSTGCALLTPECVCACGGPQARRCSCASWRMQMPWHPGLLQCIMHAILEGVEGWNTSICMPGVGGSCCCGSALVLTLHALVSSLVPDWQMEVCRHCMQQVTACSMAQVLMPLQHTCAQHIASQERGRGTSRCGLLSRAPCLSQHHHHQTPVKHSPVQCSLQRPSSPASSWSPAMPAECHGTLAALQRMLSVPCMRRILEGMALMLMQADELRIRCLEHLATILTPRQYAYVLIAPCDILQLA